MKKKLLLFLVLVGISSLVYSQSDTTWKKGGKVAINFTQVSFSNWAAGGENSFGGNGLLNLFANYKEGKRIWDSNLDLAYGLVKIGDQTLRKSDDKIDFLTKYGYEIADKLYFSTNFNFKTQFSDGYNYPNDSVILSTFLSPAYVQLGVGIDYKPTDYFSLSFLPFTGKLTIVMDQALSDSGAYGVDRGEHIRFELGAAVIAMFQKEIMKNVEFKSKLQLFSNYLENTENIDVDWDSMLSLKVNKYISSFVGVTLMYDDDINITDENGFSGPRTQWKQTFGVGFAMDF